MTRKRWRRLFDRNPAPVRRRARPDVERLEDRTTPTTLSYEILDGLGILRFTASAGRFNYVSVTLNDGAYQVTDSNGAFGLDASAAGLGFVAGVGFRTYFGGNDALIDAVVIDVGNRADRVEVTGLHDPVTVLAGAGHDEVFVDLRPLEGERLRSYVSGGPDHDTIRAGDPGPDLRVTNIFQGDGGNDYLRGSSSREVLTGGPGYDTLRGGNGDQDELREELRPGVTHMELTASLLRVGDKQDVLAGIETARLTGGDNADRLDASAFPGSVVLTGGAGADVLIGGPLGDQLFGADGADRLFGNGGRDTLSGGPGNDILNGGPGSDVLIEEELTAGVLITAALVTPGGADALASVEKALLFATNDGVWLDARLFPGRVTLVGGTGDDTLEGGSEDDWLDGGPGFDELWGHDGLDTLLNGEDNHP